MAEKSATDSRTHCLTAGRHKVENEIIMSKQRSKPTEATQNILIREVDIDTISSTNRLEEDMARGENPINRNDLYKLIYQKGLETIANEKTKTKIRKRADRPRPLRG
jgi:hypothetical protein